MTRPILVVAAVASALSMLPGCKPKAAGSCKIETKEVCVDETKALACHDGKWDPMPCRGPGGCAEKDGEDVCDQSVAADSEVCNLAGDFICTADRKGLLQCSTNRWHKVQSCLGEDGCSVDAKKKEVTCDNSVANPGDTCRDEKSSACTPDGKAALVCRSGKFAVASNCSGPKGCHVTTDDGGHKVECDDSVATLGDPCEREGHYACAADGRSIVKCQASKFVQDDKCRGRAKCSIRAAKVGCY